jgi:transcriptional regulator with XRE-family HTH domain
MNKKKCLYEAYMSNEDGSERGERVSFAKNLKKAMNERNISQAELAKQIDKGKSSISQYLSGKNIPKDDVKQKIADVLDCTVEYLDQDPEKDGTGSGIRNISVAEAARRLGKSEQFIRVGLQNQRLPFGTAVFVKRWSYHISPKLLDEYIGKE